MQNGTSFEFGDQNQLKTSQPTETINQ